MSLDLNADLGESFGRWTLGDDAALMPHLTSANVAAGFHGGDPHVLRRTVALAVEHRVGIGAHVGLPDLVGFGRRRMALSPEEVSDLVLYQAGAVRAFAEAVGVELRHVKPHGALYSMVAEDEELARALCETVAVLGVALLMPPELGPAAEAAGIRLVREGYVDLDY
ncbi:MAG TPA: 5-oxoprolinase subunit PxpA, partial [Gaiellaceae bacterium]|nr:5-oxoprolinase subunit PxpA [Gaiellaceae bacterium]